jgi:hypothetical protein
VFLLFTVWLLTMLKFVGGTFKKGSDLPRTSECKLELVYHLSSSN